MGLLKKLFGTTSEKELKAISPIVNKIEALEPEYAALTDEQLQAIDSRISKAMLGDISIPACVNARASYGGTAPSEVRRQVAKERAWFETL